MKKWLIFGASICLLAFLAERLLLQYRNIRTERINTTFSVKLCAGDNAIKLRLPEGTYICIVASDDDPMRRGIFSTNTPGIKATLKMTGSNVEVTRNFENGWLTFHVGNDKYDAINLSCDVPADELQKSVYLSVRGTF